MAKTRRRLVRRGPPFEALSQNVAMKLISAIFIFLLFSPQASLLPRRISVLTEKARFSVLFSPSVSTQIPGRACDPREIAEEYG